MVTKIVLGHPGWLALGFNALVDHTNTCVPLVLTTYFFPAWRPLHLLPVCVLTK